MCSVRDATRSTAGPRSRSARRRLLRCFLQQMLIDGHFHADPHPGNVLVPRRRAARPHRLRRGRASRRLQQAAPCARCSSRSPERRRRALRARRPRRRHGPAWLRRRPARARARAVSCRATSAPERRRRRRCSTTCCNSSSRSACLPSEFSTLFRALVTLEGTLTTLCPGYRADRGDAAHRREWVAARWTPADDGGARVRRDPELSRCRCCDAPATSNGWRRSPNVATCASGSACSRDRRGREVPHTAVEPRRARLPRRGRCARR